MATFGSTAFGANKFGAKPGGFGGGGAFNRPLATAGTFGNQQQQGTDTSNKLPGSEPWAATNQVDNTTSPAQKVSLTSICAMPSYESLTYEQLRFGQLGGFLPKPQKSGFDGGGGGGFGQKPGFGAQAQTFGNKPSGFGNTGGGFGQGQQQQQGGFGGAGGGFGQKPAGFGQGAAGGFRAGLGQQQQQQGGFGAKPGGFGGGFGQQQNQPQQQGGFGNKPGGFGGGFGQQNQPQQQQQGGFGAKPGGFGGGFGQYGQQNQQQQQQGGFGNKPGGFGGGFGQNQQAQGGFGQKPGGFGGGFGQQNQQQQGGGFAKPGFGGGFGQNQQTQQQSGYGGQMGGFRSGQTGYGGGYGQQGQQQTGGYGGLGNRPGFGQQQQPNEPPLQTSINQNPYGIIPKLLKDKNDLTSIKGDEDAKAKQVATPAAPTIKRPNTALPHYKLAPRSKTNGLSTMTPTHANTSSVLHLDNDVSNYRSTTDLFVSKMGGIKKLTIDSGTVAQSPLVDPKARAEKRTSVLRTPSTSQGLQHYRHTPSDSPFAPAYASKSNELARTGSTNSPTSSRSPTNVTDASFPHYPSLIGDDHDIGSSTNPLLPKILDPDMYTEPSLQVLSTMSPAQLSRVENFTVGHVHHGSVRWLTPTDVRSLELDELVVFSNGSIEVYPNRLFPQGSPLNGVLNKEAILSIKNLDTDAILSMGRKEGHYPANMSDEEVIEAEVRKYTIGTFISWDGRSKTWIFKVPHFTRYGLPKDVSSPSQTSQKQPQVAPSTVDSSQKKLNKVGLPSRFASNQPTSAPPESSLTISRRPNKHGLPSAISAHVSSQESSMHNGTEAPTMMRKRTQSNSSHKSTNSTASSKQQSIRLSRNASQDFNHGDEEALDLNDSGNEMEIIDGEDDSEVDTVDVDTDEASFEEDNEDEEEDDQYYHEDDTGSSDEYEHAVDLLDSESEDHPVVTQPSSPEHSFDESLSTHSKISRQSRTRSRASSRRKNRSNRDISNSHKHTPFISDPSAFGRKHPATNNQPVMFGTTQRQITTPLVDKSAFSQSAPISGVAASNVAPWIVTNAYQMSSMLHTPKRFKVDPSSKHSATGAASAQVDIVAPPPPSVEKTTVSRERHFLPNSSNLNMLRHGTYSQLDSVTSPESKQSLISSIPLKKHQPLILPQSSTISIQSHRIDANSDKKVETGLFMGRSFRVGWTCNGLLIHSGSLSSMPSQSSASSSATLSTTLHIHQLYSSPLATKTHLTSILQAHKICSSSSSAISEHQLQFPRPHSNGIEADDSSEASENNHNTVHASSAIQVKKRSLEMISLEHTWEAFCSFMIQLLQSRVSSLSKSCDDKSLPHSFESFIVCQHQLHIWQLALILFSQNRLSLKTPEGYDLVQDDDQSKRNHAIHMIRRQMLDSFLKDVTLIAMKYDLTEISKIPLSAIKGAASLSPTTLRQWQVLWTLMSAKRIKEAAEHALSMNEPRLSILIAQATDPTPLHHHMTQQLQNWEHQNLLAPSIFPSIKSRVYSLLAGKVEMPALVFPDWIRAFASYFWYGSSPSTPLHEVIESYSSVVLVPEEESSANFGKYRLASPLPPYTRLLTPSHNQKTGDNDDSESEFEEDQALDTLFHLLLLFCDHARDLDLVLNPLGNSPRILDSSLSWLLLTVLDSSRMFTRANSAARIVTDFASQLENSGLWIWSVYVLLSLPSPQKIPQSSLPTKLDSIWSKRNQAIKYYLSRHAENLVQNPNSISFLCDELGIPATWISEAKLWYYRYHQDWMNQIEMLLEMNHIEDAHELLVTKWGPKVVLDYGPANVSSWPSRFLQVLRLMQAYSEDITLHGSFASWPYGGQIYLNYFNFCLATIENRKLVAPSSLQDQLVPDFDTSDRISFLKDLDSTSQSFFNTINSWSEGVQQLLTRQLHLKEFQEGSSASYPANANYQGFAAILSIRRKSFSPEDLKLESIASTEMVSQFSIIMKDLKLAISAMSRSDIDIGLSEMEGPSSLLHLSDLSGILVSMSNSFISPNVKHYALQDISSKYFEWRVTAN